MTTYKIIRFYRDDNIEPEVIKTGLTLEEALVHTNDPTTHREGEWFDGRAPEDDQEYDPDEDIL